MPHLQANGIDTYYDLTGREGTPVVVFSNSLGGTIEMWDGVVQRLAPRYRCLRYDTRGHGRSGSSDNPIRIDDLSADLAALLDALDVKAAHVVGLSLGGMIAQALAATKPERVQSLVLVATAPHLPPPAAWQERAAIVRVRGMASVADAVIARWFTMPFYREQAAQVAGTRERFLASDPPGYARCAEAIAAMDLRDRLAAIRARTLVIGGAGDPVVPPSTVADLASRIPGAELVVLPGAAHLISVERPDAIADHIERHVEGGGVGSAFTRGLEVRKSVLGEDYVQRAFAAAGAFGAPWQDFITRVPWGEAWTDPTLPRKTRSLLTLVITACLSREDEFKLHLRPAIANGITPAELRAALIHTAVYAGVPAANSAFHWLREVLGEELGT